jgi:hypothetical protein
VFGVCACAVDARDVVSRVIAIARPQVPQKALQAIADDDVTQRGELSVLPKFRAVGRAGGGILCMLDVCCVCLCACLT